LPLLSLQYENRLLSKLSEEDISLLGPIRRVELAPHNLLERAHRPLDYVYFIERGFASVLSEAAADSSIEVGLIGPEGMTGLAVVHGVETTPFSTFVQSGGAAFRVEAERLRAAQAQSPHLQGLLMRYARAFAIQVSSTASANGTLLLEQRLARWLLMVADRAGDSFQVTHEFLAAMLSVRRPGVTRALQDLESRGLIRAMRGMVAIADRQGLVAYTKGAYGLAEEEYRALINDYPQR